MSLAQRRTAPEGINDIPGDGNIVNGDLSSNIMFDEEQREDATGTQTTLVPGGMEGKGLWQTISYDAFAQPPSQHHGPMPLADTDNLAAYEVSTTKRVGK